MHAYVPRGQQAMVAAAIRQAFIQPDRKSAGETWRHVADQLRGRWAKLGALMDEAEQDVLAYMTFPSQHRVKLHSTDEMDKRNLGLSGILSLRRRPRGEARRIGCKRRRAAPGCLAGLRRLRTDLDLRRPRAKPPAKRSARPVLPVFGTSGSSAGGRSGCGRATWALSQGFPRRRARVLAGRAALPSQAAPMPPVALPMHALAVMFARLGGVEPDPAGWPEMNRALLFGPLSPASFRLEGPYALPEAAARTAAAASAFGAFVSPEFTPEEAELASALAGDRQAA
jgi:hypothetical protein